MNITYYPQETTSTCNLANLRMVLAANGIAVTEAELVEFIEADYGKNFSNVWNPTVALIARTHGISVTMYALWPLLKKENMARALKAYKNEGRSLDVSRFERVGDGDSLPEPLSISYVHMFDAVQRGCKVVYGGLTKHRLALALSKKHLVQRIIRTDVLYSNDSRTYHSILIYALEGDTVMYHDPARGQSLRADFNAVIAAGTDVNAFMEFGTKLSR